MELNGDDEGPRNWTHTHVTPYNREALERWGEPLNVEQARDDWFKIIERAQQGEITLIAMDRAGPGWVAVIPVAEVLEPLDSLRAWGATEARGKVGDIVRAAGDHAGRAGPQLITYHRKPAAVVIGVAHLRYRPMGSDRLDLVRVLHDGGRIVIDFYPGTEPINDPDCPEPGEEEGFVARAFDQQGKAVGSGGGYTIQEALATMRPPAPPPPPGDPSCSWSTQAPF